MQTWPSGQKRTGKSATRSQARGGPMGARARMASADEQPPAATSARNGHVEAPSTVLSREGPADEQPGIAGIRPTKLLGSEPLNRWQVFGLADIFRRAIDGSASSYWPSLPGRIDTIDGSDQCFVDGGRFRLPLRGSPGFTPEFPLFETTTGCGQPATSINIQYPLRCSRAGQPESIRRISRPNSRGEGGVVLPSSD